MVVLVVPAGLGLQRAAATSSCTLINYLCDSRVANYSIRLFLLACWLVIILRCRLLAARPPSDYLEHPRPPRYLFLAALPAAVKL
jgi:hypothetical protein